MSTDFIFVPIDSLRESPTNPRRTFDQVKLQELAASIREKGVLQPLLARVDLGGGWELVAGARRLRAARLAGIERVPCVVRELTDREVLECQIVENHNREDVSPIEEAEGFGRLVELGATVQEIADKIGCHPRHVAGRIALRKLIPEAADRLQAGTLKLGVATTIAGFDAKDQAKALKNTGESTTLAQFRWWADSNILNDLSNQAPFDLADKDLDVKAGPCTTCSHQSSANPNLFPDLDPELLKNAQCSRPACFKRKLAAFLNKRAAEIKEATGVEPIRVNIDWGPTPKGVLSRGDFTESPDGVPAVVAAANGAKKIGKALTVQVKPKEPARNWEEENRRAKEARERGRAYAVALVEEILPLVSTWPPSKSALIGLVERQLSVLNPQELVRVGITTKDIWYGEGTQNLVLETLGKLDEAALFTILMREHWLGLATPHFRATGEPERLKMMVEAMLGKKVSQLREEFMPPDPDAKPNAGKAAKGAQ